MVRDHDERSLTVVPSAARVIEPVPGVRIVGRPQSGPFADPASSLPERVQRMVEDQSWVP